MGELEDQKGVIDTKMEFTTTELRALEADTTQQFHSMADLFKESLASAISSHDFAMSAQFSEIKLSCRRWIRIKVCD